MLYVCRIRTQIVTVERNQVDHQTTTTALQETFENIWYNFGEKFRNQSGGRLHLVEGVGKIPLADITLIEDPNEEDRTDGEYIFG